MKTYRKIKLDVLLFALGGFAEPPLPWRDDGDAALIKLRAERLPYKLIARRIGGTSNSLRKRAQKLGIAQKRRAA